MGPLLPMPPGVPGRLGSLMGPLEPVSGRLLVPEPGVPVSGPLEPVPGRLLVPEPGVPELPLPEPLLPDPELCASTNGAATTSTARAATTIVRNLLHISFFSSNLEGCTCLVALCEPYSPALHCAWEPCPGGQGAILMPETRAGQRALSGAGMGRGTLLL
jgi:hypothetical protein